MSVVMRGTDVAKSMKETLVQEVEALGKIGIFPLYGWVRARMTFPTSEVRESAWRRRESYAG